MDGKRKQSTFTKTRYPGVRYLISHRSGRPEKVFYALYRDPSGTLHNERVGSQFRPFKVGSETYPGMTAALANDERTRRMRGKVKPNRERRVEEKAAKESAKAAAKAQASRWTVDRLWSEWKAMNANKGGLVKDDQRYRKHIEPNFGNKEPREILPLDVDRLRIKMLRDPSDPPGRKRRNPDKVKRGPYAVGTVVSVLSLFRRIAMFGVKRRLCDGLSFKIEVPKGAKQKTEDMTPKQMETYIKTCREWPDPQAGNFQLLALYTGMRRGELMKLKWSDIDLGRGFLTIRNPKGGEDQTIPLSDAVLDLLQNHPGRPQEGEGRGGYVFTGRGPEGSRTIREVVESARAIRDAAGLPADFRPLHGLRHTFGSHLASSGEVDLYTIQRLLGHKSPLMTQRYSHLRDDALRRATNVMGRVSENEMAGGA